MTVKMNPTSPINIGMHINKIRMKLVPSKGGLIHIPSSSVDETKIGQVSATTLLLCIIETLFICFFINFTLLAFLH